MQADKQSLENIEWLILESFQRDGAIKKVILDAIVDSIDRNGPIGRAVIQAMRREYPRMS